MELLVHLSVIGLVVTSSEYNIPSQIDAWAGQNVTLECRTYDNPRKGLWRRGHGTSLTIYTDNSGVNPDLQHRINIFVNIQMHKYNLFIRNVFSNDSDVYTCITEKDGEAFYLHVALNVSELNEQNTKKETNILSKRHSTEKYVLENTSVIATPPGHTTVLKTSFQVKILYLCGGIIGGIVVIIFCASLLFLIVNQNRKTTEASIDSHNSDVSKTDSQQNPYDEIDEETTSNFDTRRTDKENCPSSYLNILNRDSQQSASNDYELIEDDVTPGENIAVSSDSCARGGLHQGEYQIYLEVTDELTTHVKQVACNSTFKESINYNNNNQGNVNSGMSNEIYRNTYQALQPNWKTPPKLYSRLTLDNL